MSSVPLPHKQNSPQQSGSEDPPAAGFFKCTDRFHSSSRQTVVYRFVGRLSDPADPVCTLSGWVNGIGSDETVGKGLAPDLGEAAIGTA